MLRVSSFRYVAFAELAMRGVTRLVIIHSGGAVFVGALREVEREFVVEVAIELLRGRNSD